VLTEASRNAGCPDSIMTAGDHLIALHRGIVGITIDPDNHTLCPAARLRGGATRYVKNTMVLVNIRTDGNIYSGDKLCYSRDKRQAMFSDTDLH